MLCSVPSSTSALADGDGAVYLNTKMVATGYDTIEGSGSFSATFTGEAAVGLRVAVAGVYGGDDGIISTDELRMFLRDFSEEVAGRSYWGVVIDSTTDFNASSEDDILVATEGVLYVNLSSAADVVIGMDFSGSGPGGSRLIQLSQGPVDLLLDSLNATVGFEHTGTLHVRDRVVMLGLGSYTTPDLSDGRVRELRTPAGNIAWYSFDGDVESNRLVQEETLTYEKFSVMENQQLSFVVVLIGSILVLRMPATRFEKYRLLHPKKFRRFAKPLISVRASMYAIVAFLSVIYLLPYLFAVGSPNTILYSSYLFFIVPGAVFMEYLISRTLYGRAALDIPEETVIEVKQALVEEKAPEALCEICFKSIDTPLEKMLCPGCGTHLHTACAERTQLCPSCEAVLFPHRTRSIECMKCGETFLYTGPDEPYAVQCTRCGAFQEDVKAGVNYLVVDQDSRNAYMMIRAMGMSGRPALVLTANFPGKVRSEYDLGEGVEIKWFSDSSTDIDNINPKDLDGDAMEIASTFLMTTKASGLLLDGADFLARENGFGAVYAFIRRLNDLAAIHGATIIMALDRATFSEDEVTKITDEFDEIHDYT